MPKLTERAKQSDQRRWAVMLHVRNVVLRDPEDGHECVGGAHTWRFVLAHDEQAAIDQAIASLRESDVYKQEVRNPASSPPIFEVEEIRTMSKPDPRGAGTTVVFYIDTDG